VKAYRVLNAKGLTVAYAAPEILQRFRPSYQTKKTSDWMASDFKTADVYALGVLLYEILNCTAAWNWNAPGSSKE
jgi:serine/threonine protein kinase